MKRTISDIWEAVRVTTGVVSIIFLYCSVFVAAISIVIFGRINFFSYIAVFALTAVSFPFVRNVWNSYKRGIEFDFKEETLVFPASDIENSFYEIVTFKSFFDLGKVEKLNFKDIEGFTNETRRSVSSANRLNEGKFSVNIVGSFGSRKLVFNSKQKRDEFRNLITRALKINSGILTDSNIDFPT
jgi:hypothetical protein